MLRFNRIYAWFQSMAIELVTNLSFVYFVLLWFVFIHLHKMLVL